MADGGERPEKPERPFIGTYILDGHTPVREPDVEKWGRWMEAADRRVRRTKFGVWEISTVFLGLDHSFMRTEVTDSLPLIFETMVFKLDRRKLARFHRTGDRPSFGSLMRGVKSYRDSYDLQVRYRTWDAAVRTHRELEKLVGKVYSHYVRQDILDRGSLWLGPLEEV